MTDTKKEILAFLKSGDYTIEEIAKKLKIGRQTISKYLAVLEAEGRIEFRKIGCAKLYKLKVESKDAK